MILNGTIKSIKYIPFLCKELKSITLREFNINKISGSINIVNKQNIYALSKWTGPKRTRTYPYAKVYDTLKSNLKITVIPLIKDEGFDGDFDYLQFDTLSLMSLLNVYVILVPFVSATKSTRYLNKITKFQIDNKYVMTKILDIQNFKSPAIHYNSNLAENEMIPLLKIARENYIKIARKTGVKLNSISRIDNYIEKISIHKDSFKMFSRDKAKSAQNRELLTTQLRESLKYKDKAAITIENHLGGVYYFTADEIYFNKEKSIAYLRESKHSSRHNLPSISDIKDALLKMIVYCNLDKVILNDKVIKVKPVLRLTSDLIKGTISSNNKDKEINRFLKTNRFTNAKCALAVCLINEARINNFDFILEKN